MNGVNELLEDEWFVVRHSGEMPEVAYHSALYFLTRDEEGPKLVLSENERMVLKEAAAERYREIVLRDLQPENRGSTAYRGVQRSIHNYRRFKQFCLREQLDMGPFAEEVSASLQSLLEVEAKERAEGLHSSAINCSAEELKEFADELGLGHTTLSTEFAALFVDASEASSGDESTRFGSVARKAP